ncbi:unnamed protein product, partial [Iphiclides podalirius]
MKRKNTYIDEQENKLSSILFSKSKKFSEKLSKEVETFNDEEHKPHQKLQPVPVEDYWQQVVEKALDQG